MSFFIEHPDEWIGVPEHWPFSTAAGSVLDPEAWIDDLAETLPDAGDIEGHEHVRQVLALAVQRGIRTGLRTFVGFEEFSGPAYIVESGVFDDSLGDGQTLLQHAGVDDPEQLGPPFAEEFVTASGLVGARCYRYVPHSAKSDSILGRVDYVFMVDGIVLVLRGAEADLVYFERLKPRLEMLAATVTWHN